jgi:hypothetical protein
VGSPLGRSAAAPRWLHTASTPTHTFYRAGEPRSAILEGKGGSWSMTLPRLLRP